MTIQVGFSRSEMDCFIPGIGMMGYGQPHNFVKEVATPLFARAVIFQDEQGQKFIFLNLELAFISIAIKEEMTMRLQALHPEWNITSAHLLMVSQHTHSAPGGFSHYPFYNFTIPGFRRKIFEAILTGCLNAVEAASKNITPSILKLGEYTIPEDQDVAFNRSMKAYLNNPEVKQISAKDNHLAIDRTMRGLNIFDLSGKLRVHINWFGVHATSISSFNRRIHHDNKGEAAMNFERKHPGAMAIFAQAAAGDVSPNYVWDKKLKRTRGILTDQYENAAYNGELQSDSAEMITSGEIIDGAIECHHLFHNIGQEASAPAHGIAFFEGTLEGPGISKLFGSTLRLLAKSMKFSKLLFNSRDNKEFYEDQGSKDVLLDHRSGEFIGIPLSVWKKMPMIPDPVVGSFINHAKNNSLETRPWVPPILPYQIVKIGQLVIVGVPGEITTIAAKRLKETLQIQFPESQLIISSYANAYMGYVTTPEEYDLQCYEGGHTVYGRKTLNAMINGFVRLAGQFKTNQPDINTIQPFRFPVEELGRRTIE